MRSLPTIFVLDETYILFQMEYLSPVIPAKVDRLIYSILVEIILYNYGAVLIYIHRLICSYYYLDNDQARYLNHSNQGQGLGNINAEK